MESINVINSPSNSSTNTPRSRARKQVFEYRVLYSDDESRPTQVNDEANAERAGTPKKVKKIRIKKVTDSPIRYIDYESDGGTPEIARPRRTPKKAAQKERESQSLLDREKPLPKTANKKRKSVSSLGKVNNGVGLPKMNVISPVGVERISRNGRSIKTPAKLKEGSENRVEIISHLQSAKIIVRKKSIKTLRTNEPKRNLRKLEVKDYGLDESSEEASSELSSSEENSDGWENVCVGKLPMVQNKKSIDKSSDTGNSDTKNARLKRGDLKTEKLSKYQRNGHKRSSRKLVDTLGIIDCSSDSDEERNENNKKKTNSQSNVKSSRSVAPREISARHSIENKLEGKESLRKMSILQSNSDSSMSDSNDCIIAKRTVKSTGSATLRQKSARQSIKNKLKGKESSRKTSIRRSDSYSSVSDGNDCITAKRTVKSSGSATLRQKSARQSIKNKLKGKELLRKTSIRRSDSDSCSEDFIAVNRTVKSVGSITPLKKSARLKQNHNVKNADAISIHNSESESEKYTPTTKSRAKLKRSTTRPIKKDSVSSDDEEFPCTPLQTKRKRSIIEKTPKSSSIRVNLLTPSMPVRDDSVATPSTPLEEARARLHVSAVPKVLLCREVIFRKIELFLEGRILDKCGGSMYISGVPGTGKTATVRHVISSLRARVAAGDLEKFEYVEVNGMRMTTPHQVYVQILQALTGEKASWEQSMKTLEKYFNRKTKKTTIILVDELDLICNKRQDIIYNLLDWPRKPDSRLVVLTIANTMDLPEKLLSAKVTSRMGLNRSIFKPYSSSELEEIVTSRLSGIEAFEVDAVRLVAKKVASISGDCRRALDICRRATEVAESEATKVETPKKRKSIVQPVVMVTMTHVQSVLEEMMSSFKIKAIKGLSRMEQLFLRSVATAVELGTDQTEFQKVYPNMQTFCTLEGIKVPTVTDLLHICSKLSTLRMIICQHSKHDIRQKILLNCDADDIHWALTNINND